MGIVKALWVGGLTNIAGALTLQSSAAITGVLSSSNTADSDYIGNTAAIKTDGGIRASKSILAVEGFKAIYGTVLKLDSSWTNTAVMVLEFNKSGGITGDATYLYSGGSSAGSGSGFIIGYNTDQVKITPTTQSTSTTTGSLITPGGVGIVKNLYVGGDINCAGSFTAGSLSYTSSTAVSLTLTGTTASTSSTTGNLINAGGFGNGGKIYGGDDINAAGKLTSTFITTTQSTNGAVSSTFENTNSGSSAYSLVGIKNDTGTVNMFVNSSTRSTDGGVNTFTIRNDAGGDLRLQNSGSTTTVNITNTGLDCDKQIKSTATTNSTSTSTGAIVTPGGAGFAKDVFVGQQLSCASLIGGISATFTPAFQSATTVTYTTQSGKYYLLGNIAIVSVSLTTTSVIDLTATALRVNGFPLSTVSGNAQYFNVSMENYALPSGTDWVHGVIFSGGSSFFFESMRDNVSTATVESPTTAVTRRLIISAVLWVA
jgi:hypothetical protein